MNSRNSSDDSFSTSHESCVAGTIETPGFSSVADPAADAHINGDYARQHPTWHVEYSPGKARAILEFLRERGLAPRNVCEVGCGAGEVLRLLQKEMDPSCTFWGCDVAPPAIEMARSRQNDRLQFELGDFGMMNTPRFDLLLALEVVDHIEYHIGFLRMLRQRAEWKLFSFSLDISVQSALRAGAFDQRRDEHSHLHHFNKEVALSTLRYAGYEVVDYRYYMGDYMSRKARLVLPLRRAFFRMAPDLSVRLFGGHSLLVLAR